MLTAFSVYRKKRHFAATPEPAGRIGRDRAHRQFVIQRHAARALHYDFRLGLDGVLKSWAIPKGPSERVGDRRLAVHVEDHPLEYASFEGDIPEGEYGAGHVDIWDRGTWTPEGDPRTGLDGGHLKFALSGERLRGRYVLIRMKPRNNEKRESWLLIRERDAVAGARPVRTRSRARAVTNEVAGVAISNADRAVQDTDGITKLEVAQYHADVAKWLLPHVTTHPLAVVKCPGGDLGHCFFQKHPGEPSRSRLSKAGTPPYMHLETLRDV